MPFQSQWTIPIPDISLATLLFTSPTVPLPTRPIIIDGEQPETHHLSLQSYRTWSQRIAAGLQAAGLQPLERVCVISHNNILLPTVYMGTLMAGGIFAGADPLFDITKLTNILQNSMPRFVLVEESCFNKVCKAAQSAGISVDNVFLFDDAPFGGRTVTPSAEHEQHWEYFISSQEVGERFEWQEFTSKEETHRTASIVYTTGTTGQPKGVELSHRNFVSNTLHVNHLASLCNVAPNQVLEQPDRLFCYFSMFRIWAQTFTLMIAPHRGVPVYFIKKADLSHALHNVGRFDITEIVLLASHVVALSKDSAIRAHCSNLNSLRRIWTGGAPTRERVLLEAAKAWPQGQIIVRQNFGMTETTGNILGWDPQAKLVAEDGSNKTSLPYQRGELCLRAPNLTKGYWNNPEATKTLWRDDGWLRTGDIAFVDKDGKFFVVDRRSEFMEIGDGLISSAEVEALLLEHPKVAAVGVIGLRSGAVDLPRAYVVPAKEVELTVEDVVDYMRKTVPLTGGVIFIDEIPIENGKIGRRLLRERAKSEMNDQ
ncbi:MAG: hypothetical protein M1827_005804 [Pycnora praestabilis]|nr:MAG: hypothetical protein M1827_005804 [Pycnora praestabilis]